MRWAHAAVVAVPCLVASLTACGSSVESASSESNSSTSTGASMGPGGIGGNGGSVENGGGGAGGTGGETSNGGGGESSTGGGSTVYPAKHPAAPQVVDVGGPIVKSPKIVPVFFKNDDPTVVPVIQDFLSKLQSSSYIPTVGAEYGVGAATLMPAIQLDEEATGTITDDEIQAWLRNKIEAGDGVFPAADANTIYTLFYPTGVTITDFGGTSCTSFGGYHFNTHLDDGSAAIYAVIPRCPADQGESAMDLVTSSTSHEILEASTDPQPYDDTAYGQLDPDHFSWEFYVGAEIGDLCALSPNGFSNQIVGMPYLVQRGWSDKQAAAGHDPCIPAPPHQVYFNSAPVQNDTINYVDPSGNTPLKGTKIAVGETKTIEIDLFSDGPTDEWDVQAFDGGSLFGQPANLEVNLDKSSGKNGDKLKLSVKVLSHGQGNVESFFLYSSQGNIGNIWVGVIGD